MSCVRWADSSQMLCFSFRVASEHSKMLCRVYEKAISGEQALNLAEFCLSFLLDMFLSTSRSVPVRRSLKNIYIFWDAVDLEYPSSPFSTVDAKRSSGIRFHPKIVVFGSDP